MIRGCAVLLDGSHAKCGSNHGADHTDAAHGDARGTLRAPARRVRRRHVVGTLGERLDIDRYLGTRAGGHFDSLDARLLPWRPDVDDVHAGIDRQGNAPLRAFDEGAIAPDREPLHGAVRRHDDLQLDQLGSQRLLAFARDALALGLALRDRCREDLAKGGPGARCLSIALVTVGEVEQRPQAMIEPLALGELRARLRVSLLGHEPPAPIEERLGGGCAVCGGLRSSETRASEHQDRAGRRCEAKVPHR